MPPERKPTDPASVLKAAKRLLREGNYLAVYHARERAQDHGLDDLDIESVIRRGQRAEFDCLDPKTGEDRWNIFGPAADGQRARVVVKIRDHMLIVITIIPERRSR